MPRKLSAVERRRAARAARALALGMTAAERRFVRELRGIVRAMHETMLDHLKPAILARVGGRGDSLGNATGNYARDIDAVVKHVVPQMGPKVRAAHKRLTDGLVKNYDKTVREVLPRVTLASAGPKVEAAAEKARDWSIGLVEEAGRVYAQGVREVFDDPKWTVGKRWEDLRDALIERGDVSESRAELIARDQTLKLNGAINKERQESSGIETYVWSTSGDERVRAEHEELDGQIFAWNDPPPPGHPGEDFQCRCIALPVIPEVAEWTDE